MEKPYFKSAETPPVQLPPAGTEPTPSAPVSTGRLQIDVTASIGLVPISGAKIAISFTGEPGSPLETLTTDSSGQTDTVSLETPPLQYSLTPDSPMPYAEYTVSVTAPGYEPVIVSGVEVLPDVTAIQQILQRIYLRIRNRIAGTQNHYNLVLTGIFIYHDQRTACLGIIRIQDTVLLHAKFLHGI